MQDTSWKLCEPRSSSRDSASRTLIGHLEGAVPLERHVGIARIKHPTPWSLIERWTARSILEVGGFREAGEIAELLGVQAAFVESPLANLVREDLVTDSGVELVAAPGLAEALRAGERPTWTLVRFQALVEPCSGFCVGEAPHLPGQNEECRDDAPSTADKVEEPSVPPASEVDLARMQVEDAPLHGLQVDRAWVLVKSAVSLDVRVDIHVDLENHTWTWDVFDAKTDEAHYELRAACEALGVQEECEAAFKQQSDSAFGGPSPAAHDAEAPSAEVADAVASSDADDAVSEKQPLASQPMETLTAIQAQRALLQLILSAREEILIYFPWVKSVARHYFQAIETALNRGVAVFVGWGISKNEDDEDSHPDALKGLRNLRSRNGFPVCAVRWQGNSHIKAVVTDRTNLLSGSHNMFSYYARGETFDTRSVRLEMMNLTKGREAIRDPLNRLRSTTITHLRSAVVPTQFGSFRSWCGHWQPLLHLGGGPIDLRAALESAPGDANPATVLRFSLLGFEFLSEDEAEQSLALLATWMQQRCSPFMGKEAYQRTRDEILKQTTDLNNVSAALRKRWSNTIREARQ